MRSYLETCSINQQKPKTTSGNKGREEVQSDPVHDLPDWLQEFRKNLVDESGPLEPRGDRAPGHRDTAIFLMKVASKSGTVFGYAQCENALSEGTKL